MTPHSRGRLGGSIATQRNKLRSIPRPFVCETTAKWIPTFAFLRRQIMARSVRFSPLSTFLLLREKGADAGCGEATAARMHRRNLQGKARTLSGDLQSRRCAQSLPLSGSSLLRCCPALRPPRVLQAPLVESRVQTTPIRGRAACRGLRGLTAFPSSWGPSSAGICL